MPLPFLENSVVEGKAFIDELRDGDGGLSREAIKTIIPYGDAFLFVDRVIALSGSQVEAEYFIKPNMPYLDSHFVDFPIMPGVLISEGCAQAGTVLVRYNLKNPQDNHLLVGRVEDARYYRPAFPEDMLNYQVTLTALGSHAARLEGQTCRGPDKISTFRLVMAIVKQQKLRGNRKSSLLQF